MKVCRWTRISLRRQKRFFFFLIVIVFFIGALISGALTVSQATRRTELSLWERIPPIAYMNRIGWDTIPEFSDLSQHELQEFEGFAGITREQLNLIQELPYVKHVEMNVTTGLFSTTLNSTVDNPQFRRREDLSYFVMTGISTPRFSLLREEVVEIVAGRTFEEGELNQTPTNRIPILISEPVASLNNLQVGSEISLDMRVSHIPRDMEVGDVDTTHDDKFLIATETYDFKVIGIFKINQDEFENDLNVGGEFDLLENGFFAPQLKVQAMHDFFVVKQWENRLLHYSEEEWWPERFNIHPLEREIEPVNIFFILHRAVDLPAFQAAANEIIYPFWNMKSGSTFSDLLETLSIFEWFARNVVLGTVISSVLLLSVLILLFLRGRKEEIAIYFALGEEKRRIIFQLVAEVTLASVIGLTLSLGIGYLFAQSLSQEMLQQSLIEHTTGFDGNIRSQQFVLFHPTPMTLDEKIASYDFSLCAMTIMFFYLIGLTIIILSTIIPLSYALRLKPNQILMNSK